jgi:hypothetical protein
MNALSRKGTECAIHELMSLQTRTSREFGRDDMDAEVAAFASAGMASVEVAFVIDAEAFGCQLAFEDGTNAFDTGIGIRAHKLMQTNRERGYAWGEGDCEASPVRFANQKTCSATNTAVAMVNPNTLKLTQVRSLALNATSRFNPPSAA